MAFHNHLLCELPVELRGLLAKELVRLPTRAGEVLQPQGEDVPACYFVESGLICVVRLLRDGTRVEAALIGREGMFGPAAAGPAAFMETEVQADGEVLMMPAERLQFLSGRHEPLRDVLARYTQFLLDEARLNAVCNARHSLDQRLAKWLLRCRDRLDGETVVITQELAAEMLGVQRTSVTGALQKLSAKGVLQVRRGRIVVDDADGLKAAACECYAQVEQRLPEVGLPQASARSECPAA